ncbi:MAG: FkbM family methyltransferase [Gammaproteobacteria bacterium]|nr:FkbM family methyltransferase [Gammaproteobacteria bacterium]
MSRLRLALGRLMQALLAARYRESGKAALERFGTQYGGWLCVPRLLGPGRVALCAGAGEDVSFDVALDARFGMRVLCVDPTPRALAHVRGLLEAAQAGRPCTIVGSSETYDLEGFDAGRFEMIGAALWREDGTLRLFAPKNPAHVSHSALNLQHTSDYIEVPAHRVSTLLAERGVAELALMKLDIEGAEYAVLDDLLSSGVRPAQLLVEFDELHSPLSPLALFRVGQRVRELRAAGYALVATEHANFVFVRRDAPEGRA